MVAVAAMPAMGEMMAPAGVVPVAAAPLKPPPPVALDPGQLQATLGDAISARTRDAVAASAEPLRAAMLLGSPDFMQR